MAQETSSAIEEAAAWITGCGSSGDEAEKADLTPS
jgi:hypothetical protein